MISYSLNMNRANIAISQTGKSVMYHWTCLLYFHSQWIIKECGRHEVMLSNCLLFSKYQEWNVWYASQVKWRIDFIGCPLCLNSACVFFNQPWINPQKLISAGKISCFSFLCHEKKSLYGLETALKYFVYANCSAPYPQLELSYSVLTNLSLKLTDPSSICPFFL